MTSLTNRAANTQNNIKNDCETSQIIKSVGRFYFKTLNTKILEKKMYRSYIDNTAHQRNAWNEGKCLQSAIDVHDGNDDWWCIKNQINSPF